MTGPSSEGGAPPQGATSIFVFGLLGFLICGVLGIVAWVQGNGYRRACQEQGVEPEGLATAGWILGIIGTILLIFQIGAIILIIAGSALTMGNIPH